MRSPLIEEQELLTRILEVFRDQGYEGSSLKDLSEASGLKKASLYHRFPRGKEEMAEAVLDFVGAYLETKIFAVMRENVSVKVKGKRISEELSTFYRNGLGPCLLDTMSLKGKQGEGIQERLQGAMDFVLGKFTELSIEAGYSKKEARQKSIMALALLEGALVITRINNDEKVFKDLMKNLVDVLIS